MVPMAWSVFPRYPAERHLWSDDRHADERVIFWLDPDWAADALFDRVVQACEMVPPAVFRHAHSNCDRKGDR